MALALLAACEGSLPAAPTAERPTAEYAHSTRSYDPLVVQDSERATSVEAVVHDAKRDRDIPLRVYLPHVKSVALAISRCARRRGGAPLHEPGAAYSSTGSAWVTLTLTELPPMPGPKTDPRIFHTRDIPPDMLLAFAS